MNTTTEKTSAELIIEIEAAYDKYDELLNLSFKTNDDAPYYQAEEYEREARELAYELWELHSGCKFTEHEVLRCALNLHAHAESAVNVLNQSRDYWDLSRKWEGIEFSAKKDVKKASRAFIYRLKLSGHC